MPANLPQGANALIPEPVVFVGIGWSTDEEWEIDASAFLVGQTGKVRCDRDFIFYNQPEAPGGCISLDMEPRSGEDMRGFHVHLSQVPEDVSKIVFT
ncbi:TerD family protein [uncultured Thiodictyon sp.]|uniref:TerD family protein n=1 Tax=uncultured Thiodictyon sp. TaxID=1846217 RepID=UPI00345817BC